MFSVSKAGIKGEFPLEKNPCSGQLSRETECVVETWRKEIFQRRRFPPSISPLSLEQNLEKRRIMALRNRLLFDVTFYIAQEFPNETLKKKSRTRTFLGNMPKWWVFQSLFEKTTLSTRTHECNFNLTGWLFSSFNPHPPHFCFCQAL